MSDHRLDYPDHQFINTLLTFLAAVQVVITTLVHFLHFMTVTFCILPQSYHDKRDENDKNEDLEIVKWIAKTFLYLWDLRTKVYGT